VGILIESGLSEPVEPAAGTGHRREFAPDQVARALPIRELKRKGVTLAQLAGKDLAFLENERFVVFDGQQLRTCRDAEAAIAVMERAWRWCSVVDLGPPEVFATSTSAPATDPRVVR
jgi:hypothetical protein